MEQTSWIINDQRFLNYFLNHTDFLMLFCYCVFFFLFLMRSVKTGCKQNNGNTTFDAKNQRTPEPHVRGIFAPSCF